MADRAGSYPPGGMLVVLFAFLTFVSGAIIYTAAENMQSVKDLAVRSLQNTALSIASSAENTLRLSRRLGGKELYEVFSDRVVAYALIADSAGDILFHTNPGLIGGTLNREEVKGLIRRGIHLGRRIVLGTGASAFEFNYVLHREGGKTELLRLVLYTTPADLIVARNNRLWWPVATVLALLWATGILLWWMLRRYIQLQGLLEHRKQLALVGQMTAVLAHEIRNALGTVKGFSQWVDEKTPGDDPRKSGLSAVLTGTVRIESLINDLLLFSRDENYTMETVAIADLFREATRFFPSAWNGRVEVHNPSSLQIRTDSEKLQGVLINGIRNSVEAMGETGILSLSARTAGRWVVIKIEDTGPGVGVEDISRLFVPFYTTKMKGSGLGLAIAEKVIKGLGGTITLANRVDRAGAVLTIRLPAESSSQGDQKK